MSENFKHTHLDTLKRACDTLTGGTQVQVMFFRPVYFCVTIYAFFFFLQMQRWKRAVPLLCTLMLLCCPPVEATETNIPEACCNTSSLTSLIVIFLYSTVLCIIQISIHSKLTFDLCLFPDMKQPKSPEWVDSTPSLKSPEVQEAVEADVNEGERKVVAGCRVKRERRQTTGSATMCQVCNIHLNSSAQAQIHCRGKTHQRRLRRLAKAVSTGTVQTHPFSFFALLRKATVSHATIKML